MEMLHVKQLSKIYDGKVPYKALENIHFTINKGSLSALWGLREAEKQRC